MAIGINASSRTHNPNHFSPQVGKKILMGLNGIEPRTRRLDWRPIGGDHFACLERFGFGVDDNKAGIRPILSRAVSTDDVEHSTSRVFRAVDGANMGY